MSRNLVIGGGPAGLTFAFLNPEFVVLDANPMTQIKTKHKLGPRFIQVNDDTVEFFKNYTDELMLTDTVQVGVKKIGYIRKGELLEEADDDFKKRYSQLTRGREDYEDSFLSAGKNKIEFFHFSSDNSMINVHLACDQLFDRMMSVLNRRLQIVKVNVAAVSPFNSFVKLDLAREDLNIPHQYDKLVSTIDLRKFMKIVEREAWKRYMVHNIGFLPALKVRQKHFYVTNCSVEDQMLHKENYAYVYSVDGVYTRKTIYYPFYTVYESNHAHPDTVYMIDNNYIKQKYENLPIQIENSINITKLGNVQMLGRYAQWNHSIRFDTLFREFNRIGDYFYG